MTQAGEATRESLLVAAERLFSERGYAAVGIREIVELAGANVAAINYHFGGKAALYRETVRRAMRRRPAAVAWALLDAPPRTPDDAALALVRFIRSFLLTLLRPGPAGADVASRLILREAAQPSEAVGFVIDDFIRPHATLLARTLHVLVPDATDEELALLAQSVLAQVLHYRTFRPFLERIDVGEMLDEPDLRRIADHLARFSLRGIGCSSPLIDNALRRAGGDVTLAAATGRDGNPES